MTMTNAKYKKIKYVLKIFYFKNIFLTLYALSSTVTAWHFVFIFLYFPHTHTQIPLIESDFSMEKIVYSYAYVHHQHTRHILSLV